MTLINIELLSFSVSFSFTSRHFTAFIKCYKMGEPSKSKFALNSILTTCILTLARFFLSTVALETLPYGRQECIAREGSEKTGEVMKG